jgi:hypothetical protein
MTSRIFAAAIFALLTVAAPAPSTANADDLSSCMALMKDCRIALRDFRSTTDTAHGMRCIGYMQGYRDAVALSNNNPAFCVPSEATTEQLILVFLRWTGNHPETLHIDASLCARTALHEAFPCSAH